MLFIAVDSHAAVNIWDLEKATRSKKVVNPNFHDRLPVSGYSGRRGRAHLVRFGEEMKKVICVLSSTPRMWETKDLEPPLVDEDWHAFFQDIFQGVEEPEWEATLFQYKDLHQAVKSKTSGENKKATVLWAMKEIKTRTQVRFGLVGCSFFNPMAALAKALKGLEQG